MLKKLLTSSLLLSILGLIYITNTSYSTGPDDWTVTNGCICHGAFNTNTIVGVNFNNGALNYNNGQTYPITITVASTANLPGGGFALSTNIGTFGTPPIGTQLSGNVWKHSTPQNMIGSNPSSASWTINWTAPASGNTQLQISAAALAASLSNFNSDDEWNFAPTANIALPVLFKNFDAKFVNNQTVTSWQVGTEINVKAYQIQSSLNGIDFNTIGQLPANGTASYTYADKETYNQNKIWYRIVSTDMDGKENYSKVEMVNIETDAQVRVYPNNLQQSQTLHIQTSYTDPSQMLVRVYNINGQLIHSDYLKSQVDNIPTSNWKEGIYMMYLSYNNKVRFVTKLIK